MDNEPIQELDELLRKTISTRLPTLRGPDSVQTYVLLEVARGYIEKQPLSKYDAKKRLSKKYSAASVERAFKELTERRYIEPCCERERKRGEGKVKLYKPTSLGFIAAAILDDIRYLLYADYRVPRYDDKLFDRAIEVVKRIAQCNECTLLRRILQYYLAQLVNENLVLEPAEGEEDKDALFIFEVVSGRNVIDAVMLLAYLVLLAEKLYMERVVQEKEEGIIYALASLALSLMNQSPRDVILASFLLREKEVVVQIVKEADRYRNELFSFIEALIEREKYFLKSFEAAYEFVKRQLLGASQRS